MDYSYSSGCSSTYLLLELQHQAKFPENSVIAMTDYSYSFDSGRKKSKELQYRIGDPNCRERKFSPKFL